ncbi:hypothetical protein [Aeromicrobium sp. UC242_57]|uniref:hypothetical protein n=1 Tax=Aeromicrobium sp. UC242_57 TaxID=3374624 RepID=UPI0037B19404
MVRQHDSTGTEPDALGVRPDRGQQHRRGAARDAGDGVVLCHPEPVVAGCSACTARAIDPVRPSASGRFARVRDRSRSESLMPGSTPSTSEVFPHWLRRRHSPSVPGTHLAL